MVEGPGATRSARKANKLIGHSLVKISGTSVKGGTEDPSYTRHLPSLQSLVDQKLIEVFSVGKECFMLFSSPSAAMQRDCGNDGDISSISLLGAVVPADKMTAVRLHFGMNGSLLVASESVDSLSRSRYRNCFSPRQPLQATIDFEFQMEHKIHQDDGSISNGNIHLTCYATTITTCTARVALAKRARLQHLDCCSSEHLFSIRDVVRAVQSRPDSMICDVLLDQSKFPGVGNIIKIEGLHQSRTHPKTLVRNMTFQQIMLVVQKCREYALSWLRSGHAPAKRVYNQTTCGSCGSTSVRMVKLGKDLVRTTFWCYYCQVLDLHSLPEHNRGFLQLQNSCPDSSFASNNHKRRRLGEKPPKASSTVEKSDSCRHVLSCPQHGRPSLRVKRVRHSPNVSNHSRLFATCTVKGCPFFVWADSNFPKCQNCNSRTIIRVSKTERTGGRWFFSCKSSNCGGNQINRKSDGTLKKTGHFSWATDAQLAHIKPYLTPLL